MDPSISDNEERITLLREFAHDAPVESGVYLWRDEENNVIYVGKAKVLRHRLSSYFSGEKDLKTIALINHAARIETIIVANEYEALLLENTLIKQYSPKYNINLKDGKTYPVIRITAEEFPRVFKTRYIIEDGSLYFGPFANLQAVDTLMTLVEKLFCLRKCRIFYKRDSPCMYYHIKRCHAPCCGKIEVKEYKTLVKQLEKILSGNGAGLIIDLTKNMHKAAAALDFERASEFRDTIRAIEMLQDSAESMVIDMNGDARDYIASANEGVLTTFTVFSMRGGKMIGRELFRTRSAANEDESIQTFLMTYYNHSVPPPSAIYVETFNNGNNDASLENEASEEHDASLEKNEAGGEHDASLKNEAGEEHDASIKKEAGEEQDASIKNEAGEEHDASIKAGGEQDASIKSIKEWFMKTFGYTPAIHGADDKHHAAILAMAKQNAREDLRKRLKERGVGPVLEEMMHALSLNRLPVRIEGFDIAQLDGKYPVASLIVFKNGSPDRKNYRIFKLRTVIGIVDDFAAMREVVERRYSRILREGNNLPDLILIDGGIGQVNAAQGVIDKLGMDCNIVGLAKREEELWLPGASEPIRLSKRSEALKLLQFVRDESHRFATSFNQKLRSEEICFSVLESIDGIGAKKAASIMKAFISLERIADASAETIAKTCGISLTAAQAVNTAVSLALANKKTVKKRLPSGAGRSKPTALGSALGDTADGSAGLAAEAASEAKPEYSAEGESST